MKADTKKINGKEANELIQENVFKNEDEVYIFENVCFDYLKCSDLNDDWNGLHACLVEYKNKTYFSGTDGISYELFAEKYYYDKENNVLYIEKNNFFTYFDEF